MIEDGVGPAIMSISASPTCPKSRSYTHPSIKLMGRSPDMQRTCCPQYTIRLESLEFKPDKKHRQVMNRFNRYLTNGEKPGEGADTEGKGKGKGKRKGKGNETGDWLETLHSYQEGYQPTAGKHKFEVRPVLHPLPHVEDAMLMRGTDGPHARHFHARDVRAVQALSSRSTQGQTRRCVTTRVLAVPVRQPYRRESP